MINKLLACFFVVGFCLSSLDASAASKRSIAQVCGNVEEFSTSKFIYKNSAPLRNSRGVMIGLRYEPTLIGKARVLASSTTIYSSNGTKIGTCPWTTAHGFAGGRYRCTMQTSSLVRAAKKASGSPTVYFKLKGNSCVKVTHAGACYGSVKGGCNRTIN